MKRFKKSLLFVTLSIGVFITSFLALDSAAAVVSAADDSAPKGEFASDYLTLEGKYTSEAWIRNSFNDNFDRWENYALSKTAKKKIEDSTLGKRNPIIFFNVNPSMDIDEIMEIGFEFSYVKSGGMTYYTNEYEFVIETEVIWNGGNAGYIEKTSITDVNIGKTKAVNSVKSSDMHRMHFTEGKNHLLNDYRDVTITEYNFDIDGSYTRDVRIENKQVKKINEFIFNIPSIGSTEVIKNFYQASGYIDKYGDSIRDSGIFDYYYSGGNSGYTTYGALKAGALKNLNYTHYLVLPIGATENLDIHYLQATLKLSDGTVISPDIDYVEVPGQPDNVKAFRFTKVNGTWATKNAVYFPGERYYKAKSILLESVTYSATAQKNDPIVAYTGAIYGDGWIEYASLRKNTPLVLGSEIALNYEFQSRATGMIVVMPEEVTDAEVLFLFEENPHDFDDIVGDPFYIILTDENGNLGPKGELPLERDPNENKSWWDKIKSAWSDLFGNNSTANSVLTLIKAFAIIIGILFLISLIIKLVNFFASLKSLWGKDKD